MLSVICRMKRTKSAPITLQITVFAFSNNLFFSFAFLNEHSCKIIPHANEQSHDGNIVQQEQGKRFIKIEENKVDPQKHIAAEVPFHECIRTICGN